MSIVESDAPKPPRGKPPIKNPAKMKVYLEKKAVFEAWKTTQEEKPTKPSKASESSEEAIEVILPPETEETDAERVLRIAQRFDIMWKYIQAVANGACRSLIISGAPGVGKSHMIEQILGPKKEAALINYRVISGACTGIKLYEAMYKGRDEDFVLVIDDADGIFLDNNGVSILKAGLDTKKVRNISWLSNSSQLHGTPETFEYKGRMIFITNLKFDQYKKDSKLGTHMRAFQDRCTYLDLCLHTKRDIMAWVIRLVSKNHILVQHDLSHEQETEVLDWMKKHRDSFDSLSIRTAEKIAKHYKLFYDEKIGPESWQTSAMQLFFRPG